MLNRGALRGPGPGIMNIQAAACRGPIAGPALGAAFHRNNALTIVAFTGSCDGRAGESSAGPGGQAAAGFRTAGRLMVP